MQLQTESQDKKNKSQKQPIMLFHASDYRDYPTGGTTGTIKRFLKYSRFDCLLVGSTNDYTVKVGKWQKVDIEGKFYDFLPIARSWKEIIPSKITLFVGSLLFYKRILEKFRGKSMNIMIFVDRQCYTALRYITARDKKINAIYKMTDAKNPLEDSSRTIAKFRTLQEVYFKYFFKPLLEDSRLIFSIDDKCRSFCEKTLITTEDRKKIIDLNHYVDFSELLKFYNDAQVSPNRKKESKKLIFWGRLAVVKGLDLIISALQKLCNNGEDYQLEIVGDGEERPGLERLVSRLQLSKRVTFHGKQPIQKIAALAKNADVFVMSSHSEGVPTSMLEAMSFGLPIVSTNVGGIASLVSENKNGYLLNSRDPEAYVQAIRKAADLDRDAVMTFGREYVSLNHSAEAIVNEMDKYIEAVIS